MYQEITLVHIFIHTHALVYTYICTYVLCFLYRSAEITLVCDMNAHIPIMGTPVQVGYGPIAYVSKDYIVLV